jgi:uncharacterized protein YggL (DUF469 family)
MAAACPVFGFVVHFRLRANASARRFTIALRTELLTTRGLAAAVDEPGEEIVISGEGCQATDADRNAVLDWLARRPDLKRFDVSPICDIGSGA